MASKYFPIGLYRFIRRREYRSEKLVKEQTQEMSNLFGNLPLAKAGQKKKGNLPETILIYIHASPKHQPI